MPPTLAGVLPPDHAGRTGLMQRRHDHTGHPAEDSQNQNVKTVAANAIGKLMLCTCIWEIMPHKSNTDWPLYNAPIIRMTSTEKVQTIQQEELRSLQNTLEHFIKGRQSLFYAEQGRGVKGSPDWQGKR